MALIAQGAVRGNNSLIRQGGEYFDKSMSKQNRQMILAI